MYYVGNETFLLLGGAGMVGQQIAYEIASTLKPKRIIISALTQKETDEAARKVTADFDDQSRKELSDKISQVAGDVFVRHVWNPTSGHDRVPKSQLVEDERSRDILYNDIFGKIEGAYPESELVWLIEQFRPDVIIDSINTATAISYQNDVYTASDLAKGKLEALKSAFRAKSVAARGEGAEGDGGGACPPDPQAEEELFESAMRAFEEVLISQSVPQLVRHVLLINRAMRKAGTRLYLKIGTTGTGGMGLNIPYTHSEESPSATLMEKTAIAFAHTGLMFLMARTFGGPAVKEFKPAAMIGYADIGFRSVPVKSKGRVGVPGQNFQVYESRTEPLGDTGSLRLRPPQDGGGYASLGELSMALVNTGENGFFTKGEFQAITFMRQMEFITPEEIARQVVLEVEGSNTGYDVIAAIDGAAMNPTYRAGYIRQFTIEELEKLEDEKLKEREETNNYSPSVALGELGPPQLGKLLWEAHLLNEKYKTLSSVLAKKPEEMADEISNLLEKNAWLRNTIVSVGIPILKPDGKTLIRGPFIRIPEEKNKDAADIRRCDDIDDINDWAERGWVDLRRANMKRWQDRFKTMRHATKSLRERGSAAFTRDAFQSDKIQIGAVVGWIFNNEPEFGYRIK